MYRMGGRNMERDSHTLTDSDRKRLERKVLPELLGRVLEEIDTTAAQTTDHNTDASHRAALQYLRSRIKHML
jgi:hypothetical protein